ncbi:MAG: hypothetical protein Q7S40_04780 [Opitutaceae bacterium]|nr:hypothetical protein [Opitutaceae bacterium]
MAQETRLILADENGAVAAFSPSAEQEGRWSWTELTVPGAAEPQAISVRNTPIVTSEGDATLIPEWTLVEQDGGRLVFEQDAPSAGVRFRRVFSFGPATNVFRIATWARALEGTRVLKHAGILDVRVRGENFHETGAAPASFPLFGDNFFVAIEHVSGTCNADGGRVYLWQTPHVTVGEDWQFVASAVIGWPVATDCTLTSGDRRTRNAFFQYLNTIRVKPADLELHTNTWWTLPVPFSESDVLKDINALAMGFRDRTGMFFDSFALDLGWSDNRSIWRVDGRRFPNELRTINERLNALGSRLGIWVSPGSGYAPGLDNTWLESAGYEVSPFPLEDLPKVACFALGGRYQREFKENLLSLVRTYGIRHVKFDFMAHTCAIATHPHPAGIESTYAIDAGLADVLDSLRAVNPNIVLEPLCTGYPPSPFWTTKTPYVLGPYGDDVPYGRVASPEWMESLITARDIAYRMDSERWVMPSQAMETIDIVVQSPGDFENLAVMAIGRGRWFISTYLKPELMPAKNWDFLAALVRWARANKQYLGNAEMIGGQPEAREAYGYMFHQHEKDIFCLRNPWMEEREIELPGCASQREPRELRMIYPRRETVARLEPDGTPARIVLAPYETVMLETIPAGEETIVHSNPEYKAIVSENAPNVAVREGNDEARIPGRVSYRWAGSITVPEITGGELYLLVEGNPAISGSSSTMGIDGRAQALKTSASAGQFGAAASPSPENWKWFSAPITPGIHNVDLTVDVPLGSCSIGVFLRGSTTGSSEPAPADEAALPLYRPGRRGWSQAVQPLRLYPEPPPEEP